MKNNGGCTGKIFADTLSKEVRKVISHQWDWEVLIFSNRPKKYEFLHMCLYKVSENTLKICGNDAKSRDLSTAGCQSSVGLMGQEIGWWWSRPI